MMKTVRAVLNFVSPPKDVRYVESDNEYGVEAVGSPRAVEYGTRRIRKRLDPEPLYVREVRLARARMRARGHIIEGDL